MKKIIRYIVLLVIYLLLSFTGIYSIESGLPFSVIITILPITSIIFSVLCISIDKPGFDEIALVASATLFSIYAITGDIIAALNYLVYIAIFGTCIATVYNRGKSVPLVIIGSGIISGIVSIVYIQILSTQGINVLGEYVDILKQAMNTVEDTLISAVQTSIDGKAPLYTPSQVEDFKVELNVLRQEMIEVCRIIFPAVVICTSLVMACISGIITNAICRIFGNKQLPKIRELLYFKISPVGVLLLVLSMILSTMNTGAVVPIAALNIYIIMNLIFTFQGILSLLGLVVRSRFNIILKMLIVVIGATIIGSIPSAVVIFAVFDSMRNYKKAEVVI